MRPLLLSFLVATLPSCGPKGEGPAAPAADAGAPVAIAPKGKVLEAAENEGPSASGAARSTPAPPAAAGARVQIPAGKLVAGSTPGDRGRDPTLEPALLDVELGA